MPELPEVETVRRGIEPHLVGRQIHTVIVRESRLRWPIPLFLTQNLIGQSFLAVGRRGKYLLLNCTQGTIIFHLGMSGSLRLVTNNTPPAKHDHLDILLNSGRCLRFNDPRRFGSVSWTQANPVHHPLLEILGPEPLESLFDGHYLFKHSRHRRAPVKVFIMNHRIVVGIGNIYANEALFLAGIHPRRSAGRIGLARYQRLADTIKTVLDNAIQAGGTTLRNFLTSDGKPGYFVHQLQIYNRNAHPCPVCGTPIRLERIGQRASYYCPRCQH
ncbi:bifunctional DNA-formamidopyrimidine glycosylase/DNA-(apurinic or apyrimidinic site) lyase [Nitrosococcus watsonii]|uniref:Formamidopyrimidine-DNA glycosylase n=1 Tax=Nitrosococcus watsoni (strain C-113) TaxID=105559 RepID=D8KAB9_NITWC|nr:bifunctional DNA-formamidopyrimidine glycosylase/DNA-(apurinic or apyrimidinic site) lyase [Nitrosococcus watsonii]ADJ27434.1 formamidopyrimidine-DNA glycosylase [Nitrosococcus watsonii C-113]